MMEVTEGISIYSKDYKDTNRLVTFFTEEFGKIDVYVRNARSPRSRFFYICQPYNRAKLYLTKNKERYNINGGEHIETMYSYDNDINTYTIICSLIRYFDKLSFRSMPDKDMYKLLCESIRVVSQSQCSKVVEIAVIYKLLSCSGYKPLIDEKENGFDFNGRDVKALLKYIEHNTLYDISKIIFSEEKLDIIKQFLIVSLNKIIKEE